MEKGSKARSFKYLITEKFHQPRYQGKQKQSIFFPKAENPKTHAKNIKCVT